MIDIASTGLLKLAKEGAKAFLNERERLVAVAEAAVQDISEKLESVGAAKDMFDDYKGQRLQDLREGISHIEDSMDDLKETGSTHFVMAAAAAATEGARVVAAVNECFGNADDMVRYYEEAILFAPDGDELELLKEKLGVAKKIAALGGLDE